MNVAALQSLQNLILKQTAAGLSSQNPDGIDNSQASIQSITQTLQQLENQKMRLYRQLNNFNLQGQVQYSQSQ